MDTASPGLPSRARERCDQLGIAPFSDRDDVLFRPWLGPAYRETVEQITAWIRAAGMTPSVDQAANIIGHYPGTTRDAPVLLIGSHIDSVDNAGRYDGMLGVMLGLEVVAHFHKAGRRFPFAIDVIGFGDEEGSRFPTYMICSRAVAGVLRPVDPQVMDADGVTIGDALADWGQTVDTLPQARRPRLLAYVEAHIEQAPHLERAGKPLGIVRGIASQYRYVATFTGAAAHAGTAMSERQDALAASAEAVLAIESIGANGPDDLVTTVGTLSIPNGAPNIVPGAVCFSIDIRALDPALRASAAEAIRIALEEIAARRGVAVKLERVQDLLGAPCDPDLSSLMTRAVKSVVPGDPPALVSQAGHDAMVMARAAPMAMLFLRCKGGISHNPAEAVLDADVEAARQALIAFVEQFAIAQSGVTA